MTFAQDSRSHFLQIMHLNPGPLFSTALNFPNHAVNIVVFHGSSTRTGFLSWSICFLPSSWLVNLFPVCRHYSCPFSATWQPMQSKESDNIFKKTKAIQEHLPLIEAMRGDARPFDSALDRQQLRNMWDSSAVCEQMMNPTASNTEKLQMHSEYWTW